MAKQDITITLDLAEIAWEVKDKTHLAGRMLLDAGGPSSTASDMQVTDDPERRLLLGRSISNAVARIKQWLHEWLSGGTVGNNGIGVNDPVVLVLHMPMNFALSATDDIAQACHRYIVDSALGDWYSVVDKSRAADYYRSADEQERQLLSSVHRRQRPQRRCSCSCHGGAAVDSYLWFDSLLWNDYDIWTEQ